MPQTESKATKAEQSSPHTLTPPDFVAMGKRRIDELIDIQTELLETLQEANRTWFDRLQTEATLTSEFATKLTGARSIPETATALQEWTSRCLEMAADDAKHLLADTQKFVGTGARVWSSGGLSIGHGGST
jgi:hypothetical protein